MRYATTEQTKVAVEASNLYSLLTSLRFQVETARSDKPWFKQVKMLGIHNGLLDQFNDDLERISGQILSSRKRPDQVSLNVEIYRIVGRECFKADGTSGVADQLHPEQDLL